MASLGRGGRARPRATHRPRPRPSELLSADPATWDAIAADVARGMDAFRRGRLRVQHNLHLGVGFLAATAGSSGPGKFRFRRLRTTSGAYSIIEAGTGAPVLMLHGLGGTKASFLPTIAALAPSFRTVAVDLLGFGDSRQAWAPRTDRISRPAASSTCSMSSRSSARTSSATAWAAGWRSSSASATRTGSGGWC